MRKTLLCLAVLAALGVGAGAGTLYRTHKAERAAVAAAQRALAELVTYQPATPPAAVTAAALQTTLEPATRTLAAQPKRLRLVPSRVSCARSGACEVLGAVTFRTRLDSGEEVERTAGVAVGVGADGEVERVDFYDATSRG